MKKFVILLAFFFVVSISNVLVAQDAAKKDTIAAPVVEKKVITATNVSPDSSKTVTPAVVGKETNPTPAVAPAALPNEAPPTPAVAPAAAKEVTPVVAPVVEEKKEMACPNCTKDKKCLMHSKAEMKKADCKMCTKDKKCEMHQKKAVPAKKSSSTKKPAEKK
jgi:hypothetical protein